MGTGQLKGNRGHGGKGDRSKLRDIRPTFDLSLSLALWNKLGESCILAGRLTNSVVLSEETPNAPYTKGNFEFQRVISFQRTPQKR
jgi:hypothetical protein